MNYQPGIAEFLKRPGVLVLSCFTYVHTKMGELLRVEYEDMRNNRRHVNSWRTDGVTLDQLAQAAAREMLRAIPEKAPAPPAPDPWDVFAAPEAVTSEPPMKCQHCGSGLLWSEDRGAHCDGCDDFNEALQDEPAPWLTGESGMDLFGGHPEPDGDDHLSSLFG